MSSEMNATHEDKTSLLWAQEITGEPASKSNSRRIVKINGNMRIIKSKKALEYRDSFLSQINPPPVPIEGDIEIEVVVWYKTRRPDLDISLIMDLLQEGLVIVNDRQIKVIKAYHQLDKFNPRSAIGLRQVSTDLILPF